MQRLETEQLSHPTDSHPPLGLRLRALGFSVEQVFDAACDVRPADCSYSLIRDAEEIESGLLAPFAPKVQDIDNVFRRRQPAFPATERGLFLNRSFLVFVAEEGLYGWKFASTIDPGDPDHFEPAAALLDSPFLFPGHPDFTKLLKNSKSSFFLPYSELSDVSFDSSPKWGMGKVPHSGRLKMRLRSGKTREFVLLGDAYGDGIKRYILEKRDAHFTGRPKQRAVATA